MYRSDDSYPVAEADAGWMGATDLNHTEPEPGGGDTEPPVVVVVAEQAESVAIVLSSPNAFLVMPPTLPVAVKFWPLVRVDLPGEQATVLLDPETHKALGATWRLWQEGDAPTAETQAAMDRVARASRERRRCCGK